MICRTIFSSLVCLIFLGHVSKGQQSYDPDKIFPISVLQDDFNVLRTALEEAHIGLYRYSDKKTIDALFDSCFNEINRPMIEIDFFKIINRMMVAVRDEHTFALPSADYWKNKIGQTVYSGVTSQSSAKLFPFFVKLIDNRLFVDNNLSSNVSIPDGTEVAAINDKNTAQVLNILIPTIHTNGFIETFRYRNLEQFSLQQTYNRFIVHYAIFIGRPDTFKLTIIRPNSSKKETVEVPALTSQDIYNHYWRRYSSINDLKKGKENPIELKLHNAFTAYLRLSDFHEGSWRRYNLSYTTEHRNNFAYIKNKGIKNLIIDLRGNEGGNLAFGMEMLKYILTNTYKPYEYHECKNYRFPTLKKYMRDSTNLDKFPDSLFIKTAQNTFRSNTTIKTEAWSRPMQPISSPYSGRLYVLTDGATGSAASILATLIRVNRKDAIFIGEETGGDMEGPISGAGMDIILPNTKIRADIPFLKRVINLVGFPNKPGRGVIPDYSIKPKIEDMISEEDTELKFVYNLIKEK